MKKDRSPEDRKNSVQEGKEDLPEAKLDSFSDYPPYDDTASLEKCMDFLEKNVIEKIGLATDGKP